MLDAVTNSCNPDIPTVRFGVEMGEWPNNRKASLPRAYNTAEQKLDRPCPNQIEVENWLPKVVPYAHIVAHACTCTHTQMINKIIIFYFLNPHSFVCLVWGLEMEPRGWHVFSTRRRAGPSLSPSFLNEDFAVFVKPDRRLCSVYCPLSSFSSSPKQKTTCVLLHSRDRNMKDPCKGHSCQS